MNNFQNIKQMEMTLEEAIVHCRDKAADDTICEKCREEHAQLAVWLEELKARRMNDLNRKTSGDSPGGNG